MPLLSSLLACRRHSARFLRTAALSLLLSLDLSAQEDMDVFNMSLEELMDITITGSTLTKKDIRSVPASVSVFTREQIEHLPVLTVEELMNLVPGYQSFRQGEFSAHTGFSARGRKSGTSGREVLVLIDGVRTDSPWTSGTAYTLPRIPLANIERIEFIRGPGSALYGSNAFMGVINIITDRNTNQLDVSVGDAGEQIADFQFSKTEGDWHLNMHGRYEEQPGRDYSVSDTFGSSTIRTEDPLEAREFRLDIGWQQTNFTFQHALRKSEDFFVLDTTNDAQNHYEQAYTQASLEQFIRWTDRWTTEVRGGYRFLEEDLGISLSTVIPGSIVSGTAETEQDEWFLQVLNNQDLTDQTSLQYGFEFRQPGMDVGQSVILGNSATITDFLGEREVYGLYGQLQHHFSEETELIVGVRYDDYDAIGSNVSPRLSAIHHLDEDNTIKLLYGEAFRAPAFNELHATNAVIVGNSALDPETVRSLEAIWVHEWHNALFHLSLFGYEIEDSIDQPLSGSTRTLTNSASNEDAQGFEAEVVAPLAEHWQLRASFTHFFETPEASFRVTDTLASVMLNYHLHDWNLNLVGQYAGERQREDSVSGGKVELDSYVLAHARLSYDFSRRLRLYAQLNNVFDESYETPPQSALSQGIPGQERTARIGLRWEF